MANRYWVGGTDNWNGTAGLKWSETSNGPGGASVPTSADDVFFDSFSTGTCTIASGNTGAKSINCTGFTGTLAGSAVITISGNITMAAGMTYTHTGTITINGTSIVITAGLTMPGMNISGSGITVTLADALSVTRGTGTLAVSQGTFTTADYNVTCTTFIFTGTSTRTVNLGSSTLTCISSLSGVTTTNLTFNAGTSQINMRSSTATFTGGGRTYYNVTFTNTAISSITISGTNTFNNLTFTGRATAGIGITTFAANQTVNGTLDFTASNSSRARLFLSTNTIGTQRTITCNAVTGLTDVDFRDIAFDGNCISGGNLTGTRLGNCKGNSNITFADGKTVYYRLTGSLTNINSASAWSDSDGGTGDDQWFPLAQDTAIFPSTYPANGQTVNVAGAYNLGTLDFSNRTTNTMTFSFNSNFNVYGNWTTGSGITYIGTLTVTFCGRTTQAITSSGKTWTPSITIDSPGGSFVLQDNLLSNRSATSAIDLTNGTLDANDFNLELILGTFSSTSTNTRTIDFGSGVWTFAINGDIINLSPTNLTVLGSGTIKCSSASQKRILGAVNFGNVTVDQAGAGTLQITGASTFKDITNTYSVTGATTIQLNANISVQQWSASGASGNVLTLNSVVSATARTITLTGGGTVNIDYMSIRDITGEPQPATNGTTPYVWYVGSNSTNLGNNLGLLFTGGGPNGPTVYQITLVGTTSWTVPSDWNSSSNEIHLIGGGGGGRTGVSLGNNRAAGAGGGGGGYTKVTNFSTNPSSTITIAVGAAGTSNSNGGNTSWDSGSYVGGGGQAGVTDTTPISTGGAGGTGTYAGGAGGDGAYGTAASTGYGAGAGGGAGGPRGVGGNGGNGFASTTSSNVSGGGGGGNGGGTSGANGASGNGGSGGNNADGLGGATTDGAAGTFGGGGSGQTGSGAGGAGGRGIDILNTVGGSGGRGGGGGSSGLNSGLYGGGGAGGGVLTSGTVASPGAGAIGCIIIVYYPAAAAVSSGNFLLLF